MQLLKRVDGFPKLHHSTASLNQAASRALKTTELSSKKSDGKRGGAPRRLLSKKSITGLFKTAARFAVQHDHLKGKSFEQILENFDTTVQKAGWSKHGNKWQRSYSPDRFGDIPPVEDSIYLNEQSEPSKAKALGTEDDVLEEKKPRRSSLGSLTLQSVRLPHLRAFSFTVEISIFHVYVSSAAACSETKGEDKCYASKYKGQAC